MVEQEPADLPEQAYPQQLIEAQSRMWGRQEFHEQLTPEEVRIEASINVDGAISSYYEDGIAPNQYYYEHSLYPQVRRRIERLEIAIPEGRVAPTDEEVGANLVPGKHQVRVSMDRVVMMMRDENTIPDPVNEVWRRNGNIIAQYRDDRELIALLQGKNIDDVVPRNIYMVKDVSEADAERNRDKLSGEIGARFQEMKAWVKFLNVVNFQDTLSEDVDNYVSRRFLQVGGQWMISRYINELLNAPESRPEFMSRGDKLVTAFEAWRDVAEGRAVYRIPREDGQPPDEIVLPNMFAHKKNWKLRQICLAYVTDRINATDARRRELTMTRPVESMPSHLKRANQQENFVMARAAELLMDHWDFDAAHGIEIYGRGGDVEINMEGAYTDAAIKLYNPSVRRASERWGNVKRLVDPSLDPERPHPRKAGSPFTIETLPVLSSHFLDTTTVEVIAKNKATGKEEKQRVTIDMRAYGNRDQDGRRRIIERDGKKFTEIRIAREASGRNRPENIWEFEVVGLQDPSIWDDVQFGVNRGDGIVDTIGGDRLLRGESVSIPPSLTREQIDQAFNRPELIFGTNSNADKIPKALMEWYAYLSIYKEFTRDDFEKQFTEYTTSDEVLKGLNKQISVGLGLLATKYELSRDTRTKLEEYIRISLVAACVSNVVGEANNGPREGQTPDSQSQVRSLADYKRQKAIMEDAILRTQFVRRAKGQRKSGSGENPVSFEWQDESDKRLYYWLIENRNLGPISPFELSKKGVNYFTPQMEEELRPLYPHLTNLTMLIS